MPETKELPKDLACPATQTMQRNLTRTPEGDSDKETQ